MARIAVLNAGGWGTALAVRLSASGHDVRLWARREEQARELRDGRQNTAYLPGVEIPDELVITSSIRDAVLGVQLVLAVPITQFIPQLASLISDVIAPGVPVVHGSKGLDPTTLRRPSESLAAVLRAGTPVGMLSGPTHAEEVGLGIPTAAVIACTQPDALAEIQSMLTSDRFRVYRGNDLVGVELCAAMKNVYAIASGVSDGLGYGDNAKAALLTRCIAELNRLVLAMGGEAGTVAGLAGIGDLVATCTSRHSRNRRAGELIGRGSSLADVLEGTDQAIEGVNAAAAAVTLADRAGVEMPIAAQVRAVLYDGKNPRTAIGELMSRAVSRE